MPITRQRPAVNPTLGSVVAMAFQAAVAAMQAGRQGVAEDDADADGRATPNPSSREPGLAPFLGALVLAAALLFAWVLLRSL
jgi:hypothetical protein